MAYVRVMHSGSVSVEHSRAAARAACRSWLLHPHVSECDTSDCCAVCGPDTFDIVKQGLVIGHLTQLDSSE